MKKTREFEKTEQITRRGRGNFKNQSNCPKKIRDIEIRRETKRTRLENSK